MSRICPPPSGCLSGVAWQLGLWGEAVAVVDPESGDPLSAAALIDRWPSSQRPRDEQAARLMETHLTELLAVCAALKGWRFRHASELELEEGVAQAFTHAGIAFERQKQFNPRDRIDFLVAGGIGVELKIKGSLSAVTAQLQRYCLQPTVNAVLLVTARAQLAHQPPTLAGKPVAVLSLFGGVS